MQNKRELLFNIAVYTDGTAVPLDPEDKPLDKVDSKNDLSISLVTREIIKSHQITVHVTNPCGWVWCGGWYWRCTG